MYRLLKRSSTGNSYRTDFLNRTALVCQYVCSGKDTHVRNVQRVRCATVQMQDNFSEPYLRVYKPHFFDKNLPSKIGVLLMHGIICPFDD
jgi:hypothetical protein